MTSSHMMSQSVCAAVRSGNDLEVGVDITPSPVEVKSI